MSISIKHDVNRTWHSGLKIGRFMSDCSIYINSAASMCMSVMYMSNTEKNMYFFNISPVFWAQGDPDIFFTFYMWVHYTKNTKGIFILQNILTLHLINYQWETLEIRQWKCMEQWPFTLERPESDCTSLWIMVDYISSCPSRLDPDVSSKVKCGQGRNGLIQ